MQWYESTLIGARPDVPNRPWTRFIAPDPETAQTRAAALLYDGIAERPADEAIILARLIAFVDVRPVADDVLALYDLNDQEEYDMFLRRERG